MHQFSTGHKLRTDTHHKESFIDYLHYFDGLSEKLEKDSSSYNSITGWFFNACVK